MTKGRQRVRHNRQSEGEPQRIPFYLPFLDGHRTTCRHRPGVAPLCFFDPVSTKERTSYRPGVDTNILLDFLIYAIRPSTLLSPIPTSHHTIKQNLISQRKKCPQIGSQNGAGMCWQGTMVHLIHSHLNALNFLFYTRVRKEAPEPGCSHRFAVATKSQQDEIDESSNCPTSKRWRS